MQYTFNVVSWGDFKFSYECKSDDMQEVMKNVASCVGCSVDDLRLLEKKSDRDVLREKLPQELFEWADYYAYEQGHYAGDDEILLFLTEIVNGLSDAVNKFYKRTCDGGKIDSTHFPGC